MFDTAMQDFVLNTTICLVVILVSIGVALPAEHPASLQQGGIFKAGLMLSVCCWLIYVMFSRSYP